MFSNVLFPIDLHHRDTQEMACRYAIEFAQNSGGKLHLMSVVPDLALSVVGSFFPEDLEEKALEAVREELADYNKLKVPEAVRTEPIVAYGTVYTEILEVADKVKPDLIVMASHQPKLEDYLLGPNASRVVRHAKCSVLVIRDA